MVAVVYERDCSHRPDNKFPAIDIIGRYFDKILARTEMNLLRAACFRRWFNFRDIILYPPVQIDEDVEDCYLRGVRSI